MIYLVADIHGHIRLSRLKELLRGQQISERDHLIILGDAGIVWSRTEHKEVQAYYEGLPLTTLFLDGNHENFDLLEEYPILLRFGGRVHKVSDKIYHLMRGECYIVEGKRMFVFGGGFSQKKLTRTSPVCVWEREMPDEEEYRNAEANLIGCGRSVDYILTHVAPKTVADVLDCRLVKEELVLNTFLEGIRQTCDFKRWYFGHHHKDLDGRDWSAIYDRLIKIGD